MRRGNYDLVGVTSYTSGATRAYEIAEQCRGEGIPTIMGGPHASAMPDEAAQHFDSVAVGECDDIWATILDDAANGRLQKRYTGRLANLENSGGRAMQHIQPINGKYDVAAIQTSRGCPVGCEYCSVTLFNGAPIRRRNIDEIIAVERDAKKFIFVVDDTSSAWARSTGWAKELLREIIKRVAQEAVVRQTTNTLRRPGGSSRRNQAAARHARRVRTLNRIRCATNPGHHRKNLT